MSGKEVLNKHKHLIKKYKKLLDKQKVTCYYKQADSQEQQVIKNKSKKFLTNTIVCDKLNKSFVRTTNNFDN